MNSKIRPLSSLCSLTQLTNDSQDYEDEQRPWRSGIAFQNGQAQNIHKNSYRLYNSHIITTAKKIFKSLPSETPPLSSTKHIQLPEQTKAHLVLINPNQRNENGQSSLAPFDYLEDVEDRATMKIELARSLTIASDRFLKKHVEQKARSNSQFSNNHQQQSKKYKEPICLKQYTNNYVQLEQYQNWSYITPSTNEFANKLNLDLSSVKNKKIRKLSVAQQQVSARKSTSTLYEGDQSNRKVSPNFKRSPVTKNPSTMRALAQMPSREPQPYVLETGSAEQDEEEQDYFRFTAQNQYFQPTTKVKKAMNQTMKTSNFTNQNVNNFLPINNSVIKDRQPQQVELPSLPLCIEDTKQYRESVFKSSEFNRVLRSELLTSQSNNTTQVQAKFQRPKLASILAGPQQSVQIQTQTNFNPAKSLFQNTPEQHLTNLFSTSLDLCVDNRNYQTSTSGYAPRKDAVQQIEHMENLIRQSLDTRLQLSQQQQLQPNNQTSHMGGLTQSNLSQTTSAPWNINTKQRVGVFSHQHQSNTLNGFHQSSHISNSSFQQKDKHQQSSQQTAHYASTTITEPLGHSGPSQSTVNHSIKDMSAIQAAIDTSDFLVRGLHTDLKPYVKKPPSPKAKTIDSKRNQQMTFKSNVKYASKITDASKLVSPLAKPVLKEMTPQLKQHLEQLQLQQAQIQQQHYTLNVDMSTAVKKQDLDPKTPFPDKFATQTDEINLKNPLDNSISPQNNMKSNLRNSVINQTVKLNLDNNINTISSTANRLNQKPQLYATVSFQQPQFEANPVPASSHHVQTQYLNKKPNNSVAHALLKPNGDLNPNHKLMDKLSYEPLTSNQNQNQQNSQQKSRNAVISTQNNVYKTSKNASVSLKKEVENSRVNLVYKRRLKIISQRNPKSQLSTYENKLIDQKLNQPGTSLTNPAVDSLQTIQNQLKSQLQNPSFKGNRELQRIS